jgi:hypothetical protein
MARPVYPYEMSDPDFTWLFETFQESHPDYLVVQDSGIPLVLIARENPASSVALSPEEFVPENPFEKLLLHESEGEEPIDKK